MRGEGRNGGYRCTVDLGGLGRHSRGGVVENQLGTLTENRVALAPWCEGKAGGCHASALLAPRSPLSKPAYIKAQGLGCQAHCARRVQQICSKAPKAPEALKAQ